VAVRNKIIFLLNTLTFGGAEKQSVDLVNNLDSTRFATTLCHIGGSQSLLEAVRQENLEGVASLGRKGKFDLSPLKRFFQLVSAKQPDVVVCVNPYPSLYAHLIRFWSRRRFRIIVVMHSTLMRNRYEHLVTKFLFSRLVNLCDKVVFVCRNQMEYWCRQYGINRDKATFIYNGIDIERFTDRLSPEEKVGIRSDHGIADSDIVICICAALRPEKRHTDLIDAGRILVGKGLPVKILIIGDGPQREMIEKHVAACGMSQLVIMAGFQQDVRRLVAIADIVAITSDSETFSIAILEAMALGKAIVAPNIGGVPEQVIDGENGFLFPSGDVAALAEKLERASSGDMAVRMGQKSRAMVAKKFNLGLMIRQYEELLTPG
jgi:glycosyltransferase involved in cell wall biosynthesis